MDIWYFGLHYIESVFVFTLKVTHPEGKKLLRRERGLLIKRFELLTWIRTKLDFLGIPYAIAPMWYQSLDMLDFRDPNVDHWEERQENVDAHHSDELPTTTFQFANVRILIVNIMPKWPVARMENLNNNGVKNSNNRVIDDADRRPQLFTSFS